MTEWYKVGTIVAVNLGIILWSIIQTRSGYLHRQSLKENKRKN